MTRTGHYRSRTLDIATLNRNVRHHNHSAMTRSKIAMNYFKMLDNTNKSKKEAQFWLDVQHKLILDLFEYCL